jgi:hypothetical protein
VSGIDIGFDIPDVKLKQLMGGRARNGETLNRICKKSSKDVFVHLWPTHKKKLPDRKGPAQFLALDC